MRRGRIIGTLLAVGLAVTPGWTPAAAQESDGIVAARNGNLAVRLGGRVHRMILGVADGANRAAFFTDAEQGPTTIRLDVTGTPSDALSLGAVLELAVQQNRPFRVSQDQPDPGLDLTGRLAEVFVQSRIGKLSLGRGFAASWYVPEIDLSMTQFAAVLSVGMLSPGLKFVDRATDSLSSIQVLTHFADLERLLIQDRLRYDSPRLAGFQASGTAAADGRWDTALRARHDGGGVTVTGAASYAREPYAGIDWRWDVGLSVRHEGTGLSATGGYSHERLTRGADGTGWVVKLGWLADLVPLGTTAFAVDVFRNHDIRFDGDRGTSFGAFAMQKWPAYGLDVYVGVRRYDVDRPDIDLEPLLVAPVGVVLSF